MCFILVFFSIVVYFNFYFLFPLSFAVKDMIPRGLIPIRTNPYQYFNPPPVCPICLSPWTLPATDPAPRALYPIVPGECFPGLLFRSLVPAYCLKWGGDPGFLYFVFSPFLVESRCPRINSLLSFFLGCAISPRC